MKKAIALLVALSVCILGLQAENKPLEKVTLLTSSSKFKQAYRTIADKMRSEKGIDLDIQVVPDDQYENIVKTKIASRELPDLIEQNAPEHYESMRVEENFVDLSREPWVSRVVNPKMMRDRNGKIWALPQESGSFFGACYYNRAVLDRLGIHNPQPKTYAEFTALLDRIRKADKHVVPLFISGRDPWTVQIFMTCGYSFGLDERCADVYGRIMKNKLKFSAVPEFRKVLSLTADLIKKGYVNADYLSASYDDALAAVSAGKAAMVYNGEWVVPILEAQGTKVGAFPIPWFDRPILSAGAYCQGFFIPKYAKNVAGARRALNLLASPEYMNIYYAENPGFPGLKGVDGGKINPDVKAMINRYVSAGKTVSQMNDYMPQLATLWSELWGYYVELLAGTKTPDQVLAAWDAKIADHMQTIGEPGW